MARKILLADDSVTAQNMGRKILADAGYEVIAVNNGSAALKKITECKPDLVILDVYMPGYSGLEVCQRLKESQETARIPVLLTVGKLEPFKPEEAQRVRAEGYIVKPFEASELLSALSKLEDKIVPRAEPSKPGRFARAMAAADETDRNSKNAPSSNETGWKNRIAFPSKKTEGDEIAEEAQSASPGNFGGNKQKRHASASEEHVDVAAFAPIGVPKDVTPAEVAAIAAAAAQIQVAEASSRKDDRTSESAASQTSEFAVEPTGETYQDCSDQLQPAPSYEPPAAGADHNSNGGPNNGSRNGDEKLRGDKLEDSQAAPVTIAATGAGSSESAGAGISRWTAVPVALENDETSISLDREMQKAYAAFAPADYATSAGTVEAEATVRDMSSSSPETVTEAVTEAHIETPSAETQPASAQEPVSVIAQSEPTVADSEPVPADARIETAPASELATPELATPELATPDSATPEIADPEENLADSASLNSIPETVVADAMPATEAAAKEEPSAPEPVSTESVSPAVENSEAEPDSAAVKSTAAAWANWRQIRDSAPGNGQQPEVHPQEPETPAASAPDVVASAVAAGAENALQDGPTASTNGNPTDVASIVDSVLAGLRPKLMEEITRKMSEKK